jgi:hypothetical protein
MAASLHCKLVFLDALMFFRSLTENVKCFMFLHENKYVSSFLQRVEIPLASPQLNEKLIEQVCMPFTSKVSCKWVFLMQVIQLECVLYCISAVVNTRGSTSAKIYYYKMQWPARVQEFEPLPNPS